MAQIAEQARKTVVTPAEFLAQFKKDPSRTEAMLRGERWGVVAPPIDVDDFDIVFNTVVAPDGTVDMSALSESSSDLKITPVSFGHAMVEVAAAVVALCLTAAAAGYQLGTAIGDALDDDKDEQRSRIVLVAHSDRLTLSVAGERSAPAGQEITLQDALARMKREGRVPEKSWLAEGLTIVSPSFRPRELLALIESAVGPDGSVDLDAFSAPSATDVAAMGPLGWAITAVATAAIVSFGVGVAIGFAVETLGDDAPQDAPSDPVDGGDTATKTSESHIVTATLRPGDGSGIDMMVRSRTGS